MKSLLIKISVMALVIAGIAAFVIRPGISSADPVVYTVTGHAFSDMPDTSDQVKTLANHYGGRGLGWIAMKGSNYGVTLNPATGDFGGYGWSEFGGYVNFSGVKVDKTCLVSNDPCDVTGTFTFVSAAADPQSGGWDGQVRMSDPSWTRTVSMKAPVNGVREMTGFAWGGDVVGWVDFSQVKVNVSKDLCTNIFGVQETIPDGMVKDPASPADEPGVCHPPEPIDVCTNIEGPQTEVPSGYIKDPASPADAPGICTPDITICPTPAPETNYPTMPGYNSLCPIVCKKPLVLNTATQVCELPNGDQCPTTKVSNPLNPINGQNDPQTTGIENPIPAGYTLIGNKCGIPGCGVSYAKNFDNNANATIDICDYCPKGSKWNTTTKQCEVCSDPKAKECNPPKGFISPILKEV